MCGSDEGIASPDVPSREVLGTTDSPDVLEVLMEADRPQEILETLCQFADGHTEDEKARYIFRLICDEFLENIASYAYTSGNGPVLTATVNTRAATPACTPRGAFSTTIACQGSTPAFRNPMR